MIVTKSVDQSDGIATILVLFVLSVAPNKPQGIIRTVGVTSVHPYTISREAITVVCVVVVE